jgi:predicted hotdog family 3-hydroxylacyl-ACP dehydratase
MSSGNNQPIAKGADVVALIPQRAPFVMIDSLFFSDRVKTVSGFTVPGDCILCQNGVFTESGLVENIAQTAAAGVGYVCMQENTPVPIGFIAAIKDLVIHQRPAIGSSIRTEVVIENNIMDITIVRGKVLCGEVLQAECEMRIFLKPA